MKPDVLLVNPPDLNQVWPRIAQIIDTYPGLREQYTLGELMIHLLNGSVYHCWVGVDDGEIEGLMITARVPYVNGAKVHIVGICGEHLDKYLEIGLEKLERWSCLTDVSEIIFDCRPGFKRLTQKFGYHQTIQMRKNVRQLWAN